MSRKQRFLFLAQAPERDPGGDVHGAGVVDVFAASVHRGGYFYRAYQRGNAYSRHPCR